VIDAAMVAATPPSQNGYGLFLDGAVRVATDPVTTGDSDIWMYMAIVIPLQFYRYLAEDVVRGIIGTELILPVMLTFFNDRQYGGVVKSRVARLVALLVYITCQK